MKFRLVKLKVISLWLFAVVLMAVQPVAAQESIREIEETEEVKLYTESKQQSRKKPRSKLKSNSKSYNKQSVTLSVSQVVPFEKQPKYIMYCNLILYA